MREKINKISGICTGGSVLILFGILYLNENYVFLTREVARDMEVFFLVLCGISCIVYLFSRQGIKQLFVSLRRIALLLILICLPVLIMMFNDSGADIGSVIVAYYIILGTFVLIFSLGIPPRK